MAGTAVLERQLVNRGESTVQPVEAELEHARRISENFKALQFASPVAWADSSVRDAEREVTAKAPAAQPVKEAEDITARRIADYVPVPETAPRKHDLFAGLTYKNGELLGTLPSAPAAPVAAAVITPAAPAVMPAPSTVTVEEDDALPTRRTMEMLQHAQQVAERVQEETRTGYLSALSAKTKKVLLAIAAAIVLALIIICVNTSIISSLNTDVAGLRAQAQEELNRYEAIMDQLDEATSPDRVNEWAQANGFVRGE